MRFLVNLRLFESVLQEKEVPKGKLPRVGNPFQAQVKLLMSIRGNTPLLALAILEEVAILAACRV